MIELLGWVGTAGYLLNHTGFSLKRRYPLKLYFGLNFVSAILLVISSLAISSWHPVINNGFWAITSLIALSGLKPLRVGGGLRNIPWLLMLLVIAIGALFAAGFGRSFETLGWVSVITYAMAYIALTSGAIGRKQYLLVNIIAALLQIPILMIDQNLPVLGLQVAWAVLSLIGLIRRFGQADTEPWVADLPPGGMASLQRPEDAPDDGADNQNRDQNDQN